MNKLLTITACTTTAIASFAQAGDLTMRLTDHDGQSVRYSYDNGAETFGGRTSAGLFTWRSIGVNDRYGDAEEFYTFCVEIVQRVTYNRDYEYDFADIIEVPSPNAGLGDMDEGQAAAMSSLLDQHWNAAVNGTVLQSAAFQLAAWEIVYEGAGVDYGGLASGENVTGLSTQNGWFQFTENQSAIALADQWLGGLFNNGISERGFGFTNPNRQDQISMAVIPLPAPIALAALGLLGVAAGRRRMSRSLMRK